MLTGITHLSKKYNFKNKIFSKFTIEWEKRGVMLTFFPDNYG